MELETETGGCLPNPTEEDIREVFDSDAIVGSFIRLSRAPDDFVHVELEVFPGAPPNWTELDDIRGVYIFDPEYGRFELECFSPDSYTGETLPADYDGKSFGAFGGEFRQQLLVMFLHFLRGPDAFAQWEKAWNGEFRSDEA